MRLTGGAVQKLYIGVDFHARQQTICYLHGPAVESREVLRMLRYRQKLIKLRTMTKNSLQAIALQAGLAKGKQLFTAAGQEQFQAALMSPVLQWQREHWFELLKPFNQQLLETMVWSRSAQKVLDIERRFIDDQAPQLISDS